MAAVSTPALDASFVAPDFRLRSVDGNYYSITDLRGSAALLVMFICNHCPYVKSIIEQLVHDVRILSESCGVGVVAIMPNDTDAYPEDSYENMQAFAKEHSIGFPYMIDAEQSVARAYGAVCTPDFFCFNNSMRLCYRGRFDDPSGNKAAGKSELFKAVQFVVETGGIPEQQVPSIGCSIKWRRPTSPHN